MEPSASLLDRLRDTVKSEMDSLGLSHAQIEELLHDSRFRESVRALLRELAQERPHNAEEVRVRLQGRFFGVADARKAFGYLISDEMVNALGDVPNVLLRHVREHYHNANARYLRVFPDFGLSISTLTHSGRVNIVEEKGHYLLLMVDRPRWRLVDMRDLHIEAPRQVLTLALMELITRGDDCVQTWNNSTLGFADSAFRGITMTFPANTLPMTRGKQLVALHCDEECLVVCRVNRQDG